MLVSSAYVKNTWQMYGGCVVIATMGSVMMENSVFVYTVPTGVSTGKWLCYLVVTSDSGEWVRFISQK